MTDHKALARHIADGSQLVTLYPWPEFDEETQRQLLDFAELKAIIFRQRYWIIGAILFCLLLGLAATMTATRIYSSTASVQVEENISILSKGQEAAEPTVTTGNMQRYLQAQVDILKSRHLATRVADQLRLHEGSAFLDDTAPAGAELSPKARREAVVNRLQAGISAEAPGMSQVIFISYRSSSPTAAAAVANAYAENLITRNLERKYRSNAYARGVLSKELERTKQRLEASERAAVDYARRARIVDTSSPALLPGDQTGRPMPSGSLPAADLASMNADLADARTAHIQAEQRWRAAAAMPIMSLPEIVQNDSIQDLQSERAALVAGLDKLQQTFLADYPDVIRAKAAIAAIDAEIQARAMQILNSVRQQYLTAARQERALGGRMGGFKAATLQEQDRRVQLDILNRDAATNRSLYDALLKRYREVSAAVGVTNNNVSILDKAVPSGTPISPKPVRNMVLALVAGLGLGLAIAFLRDRLTDRIRSPGEVPSKLGLPLLGTTPAIAAEKVMADLALPSSGLAESYHSIRSSIEFVNASGVPSSLLITSSRPGEGKSTTALAMAADFSAMGSKVLLVDADLRRPSLHKAMGVPNENGFVHVLAGRMPLELAVTTIQGIDFLPGGATPPNPTELLERANIRNFLHSASAKYHMVIFDGPPAMGLADSPQISSMAESTLLVVEAAARRREVRTVIARLRTAKANLAGVVMTKFSSRHCGYGHDYGHHYEYPQREQRETHRKSASQEAI